MGSAWFGAQKTGRLSSEAGDGGCRSSAPYRNPSRQDRCDRGDDARDRTATGCVERIGAAAMDRGRRANQLWAEPARDDRVPMDGQRLASLSPDRQTGGNTISRRLRGFLSFDDQSAALAESIGVLAQRWRESGRSRPTPWRRQCAKGGHFPAAYRIGQIRNKRPSGHLAWGLHPLSIYQARDRGLAGSFVLAFAGARGCVFVTPKSERIAGRNSSHMSAAPVASPPPLSSCAQEFPADQIALNPVNVRSRRNSVVSALVDAAFVRPLRCKIRQLICLKVSLHENLDHLRCLASANQWRRADFGNDGQGIGAIGT